MRGPYGEIDWPAGCDPYWSDLNGACSDNSGNFVDQATGQSIDPLDLANFLRGVANAQPGSSPPAKPAGTQPAPAGTQPKPASSDPLAWFKTGNNALFAVVGFFALILLMSTMGGRK